MSALPSPADHEPGAGGVFEIELKLIVLLIEFEQLDYAWPNAPQAVDRAKIGQQRAPLLSDTINGTVWSSAGLWRKLVLIRETQ